MALMSCAAGRREGVETEWTLWTVEEETDGQSLRHSSLLWKTQVENCTRCGKLKGLLML